MGLFGPAWQSRDETKAVRAVESITDPDLLLEIILAKDKKLASWANETPSSKAVRMAAVRTATLKNIIDENSLKQIAEERTASFVRETALECISEKTCLCDFARHCNHDEPIREFAVRLLKGEELLLLDVALHAISTKVSDQAALLLTRQENIVRILQPMRVFTLNQEPVVRELFLHIDENARLQICVQTKDSNLRRVGETTLSEKSLLIRLARETGYFGIRNAGVLKSLTQNELYFCFQKAFDLDKALLLLDELWDSALLLKAADDEKWKMREEGERVIRRAISRISNVNFINRAAAERHAGYKINETSLVLELLVERVEDQSVLAQIAKNTRVSSLCKVISRRLTDIQLLYDVAQNGKRATLFETMIPRITDPMLLAYIVCRPEVYVGFSADAYGTYSDVEESVRQAAMERLKCLPGNEPALQYISKNQKHSPAPGRTY